LLLDSTSLGPVRWSERNI